jgi:hypothetical protein
MQGSANTFEIAKLDLTFKKDLIRRGAKLSSSSLFYFFPRRKTTPADKRTVAVLLPFARKLRSSICPRRANLPARSRDMSPPAPPPYANALFAPRKPPFVLLPCPPPMTP